MSRVAVEGGIDLERAALLVTGFHWLLPVRTRLMIKSLFHRRVSVFRGGDRSRQAIMAGQTSGSRSKKQRMAG